ncbi:MAG: metalloregulator ArsR/SmtB family transcription factor [Clostridium sp.]|jgi:ArsR family transcriptional regulator|nr:metalloregulator ArsR/SmtB family transcription factor [Clostridium sp.]
MNEIGTHELHVDEKIVQKVKDTMPPDEELWDLAEFFKVFADSTRLKILHVLRCSPMCVIDIATLIGMSQSAVSHQLRVLKQMSLVKHRRDGKTIFYTLADDHIMTIFTQGLSHIEE